MSRLNIIESLPLTDDTYRWYPQGIWGMFDLLRYLHAENKDPDSIDAVKHVLATSLQTYANFYKSPNEAAGKLVDAGYIDNRLHAMKYFDTSASEPSVDPVTMPGVYLIGVCGLIRAGKGTVGEILVKNYDALHFQFVDSLIAFSVVLGYSPFADRKAKREVNDLLKPRFGNAIFAESTIRRAARMARMKNPPMVCVDGFRSVEEVDLLRAFPRSMLVAVTSTMENRYARAQSKKGQEPKSFADFKYDSDFEERTMMGAAIGKADVTFENNSTTRDLQTSLKRFFHPIIWGEEYK